MGCWMLCAEKKVFRADSLSNPRNWGRLPQVRSRSERKNPCDNVSEAGCKSRWKGHSPVPLLPVAERNLSEQPSGFFCCQGSSLEHILRWCVDVFLFSFGIWLIWLCNYNSLSRGDMMDMVQADVWRDFNCLSCLAVFASHFRKKYLL